MSGINSSAIHDLPIAVVDVETTGLHPRGDRIVEIAIARVEPGEPEPRVVLETLVNPGRKVSATEIHGISDDDVKDAPNFGDLAPAVAKALEGAAFAAYNVYFDAKFVAAELARFGISEFPPHLSHSVSSRASTEAQPSRAVAWPLEARWVMQRFNCS